MFRIHLQCLNHSTELIYINYHWCESNTFQYAQYKSWTHLLVGFPKLDKAQVELLQDIPLLLQGGDRDLAHVKVITLLVGCNVWYWKIALIKGFTLFSGNSVFQIFIQKWLIYTGLHVAKIVEPLLNQNKSPSRALGIGFQENPQIFQSLPLDRSGHFR